MNNEDSDKFTFLYGKFLMRFSSIEKFVTLIVSQLVEPKSTNIGLFIASELSFRKNVILLEYLAKNRFDRNPKLLTLVTKLVPLLDKVEGVRNKIVHSAIIYDEQCKTYSGFKTNAKSAKKGIVFTGGVITNKGLENNIEFSNSILKILDSLLQEVIKEDFTKHM